jgi:DnaJ-class molecular chaperone
MPDRDWQAELALLQARDLKSRAVLGVSEAAGRTEIRRAFRRASLAHHPDSGGGDDQAWRRFHLIRCAYEFLTEGRPCAALDELDEPPPSPPTGKYRLDNPWGYWCWWRETFFGDVPQEDGGGQSRASRPQAAPKRGRVQ